MRILKNTLLVLFILLIAVFSIQNSELYNLKLFNWKVELPVSLLVFLVYILGMSTGGILFSVIKNLMETNSKKKIIEEETEENQYEN